MIYLPFLAVILALLLVWFSAEYILALYVYRAALDVYGLLSFEFETVNEIERKIKKSDGVHIQRLLESTPLKIVRFKNRWSKEECFDYMSYTIIHVLTSLKMAEALEFIFVDMEKDSFSHPFMKGLNEDDIAKYREEERDLQETASNFGNLSKSISPNSPEKQELLKDIENLNVQAKEALHSVILCVRKLPFTGRPEKVKPRIVTSPSEVMG